MKQYIAVYYANGEEISNAAFEAVSLHSARKYAQFHKRHTPEIMAHKNVQTRVKLKR